MIEADILLRGHEPKEPILAHPPMRDSDITLQEWLEEVLTHNKGIKLDFKRFVTSRIGWYDILNERENIELTHLKNKLGLNTKPEKFRILKFVWRQLLFCSFCNCNPLLDHVDDEPIQTARMWLKLPSNPKLPVTGNALFNSECI